MVVVVEEIVVLVEGYIAVEQGQEQRSRDGSMGAEMREFGNGEDQSQDNY